MATCELRFAPTSLSTNGRTLTGLAAPYNVETRVNGKRERIAPGAFRDTLADGHDILLLADHAPSRVLARTRSALAGDKVRTPAGRHLAAESVAKAIGKDLARTHDRVADLAHRAVEESNEEILSVLGAFSGNEWVYQGAMPWFRELAANSDGRVKIGDAIREDVRLAQVVWNAPHHMLGFGKDAAAVMRETVAKKWAGEAWERLNEGLSVQKTLPNYTKVIGDFHASAYNPAVIEMAQQSHVEV